MARGGSRGGSRSPSRSSSAASRPVPTQAPRTPTTQTQPQSGGMLGGFGSTLMQGMAFGAGSEVAHRAIGGMMGGGSHQTQQNPQEQQQQQQQPQQQQQVCQQEMMNFGNCLQQNDNVNYCQNFSDMLKSCKQNHGLI